MVQKRQRYDGLTDHQSKIPQSSAFSWITQQGGEYFFLINIIYKLIRTLSNDDCDLEKPYICMQPNLKTREQKICPAKFVAYKGTCFYHGSKAGDYDHGEEECAKVGAKVIAIKERATYQFIRAWASLNKFGDFYLGLNFTHNSVYYHHNETDPNVTTTIYSDGSPFDKTINYAFDDQSEKFGNKECAYLKKGVAYKPRDTLCNLPKDQVCEWKREYAAGLGLKY